MPAGKKKSKGKGKQKKKNGRPQNHVSDAGAPSSTGSGAPSPVVPAADPKFQEYRRAAKELLATLLVEHEKCGGEFSSRWWEAGLKKLNENADEARKVGADREGLAEVMVGVFNYYLVKLLQARANDDKIEEEVVLGTLRRLVDTGSTRSLRMFDLIQLERDENGQQTYALYRDVPIAYHENIIFPCVVCGISGNGRMRCGGCQIARYCNMNCKTSHRRVHRSECGAMKRERQIFALDVKSEKILRELFKDAADTDLFALPPPREECPVCMLPLPFADEDGSHAVYMQCCGQRICNGCVFENRRVTTNARRIHTCPFCREPEQKTAEGILRLARKRMEKNDPRAFFNMSLSYENGRLGLPQDELMAFDLMLRAAKLGSADACYNIAQSFDGGKTVDVDPARARRFYEIAAKWGSLDARHKLGMLESEEGDEETAFKHFSIGARAGDRDSMLEMKFGRDLGAVSNDEYAQVSRAFKKVHDEVWSKERERCPSTYS